MAASENDKELADIKREFKDSYKKWDLLRQTNIRNLNEASENFDGRSKGVLAGKVGGAVGGTAAAATGIGIVSAVLAPFTFGASLLVGGALAGATVGIGAAVSAPTIILMEKAHHEKRWKTLKEGLEGERTLAGKIRKSMEMLEQYMRKPGLAAPIVQLAKALEGVLENASSAFTPIELAESPPCDNLTISKKSSVATVLSEKVEEMEVGLKKAKLVNAFIETLN